MKQRHLMTALFATGLLFAPWQTALANQPLSHLLETAINAHPGVLTEAELEDGVWEIKSCDAQTCTKIYINPVDGKIRSTKKTDHSNNLPNKDSESLLSIVKRIEAAAIGDIVDIEFKRNQWKIDIVLEQAPTP